MKKNLCLAPSTKFPLLDIFFRVNYDLFTINFPKLQIFGLLNCMSIELHFVFAEAGFVL